MYIEDLNQRQPLDSEDLEHSVSSGEPCFKWLEAYCRIIIILQKPSIAASDHPQEVILVAQCVEDTQYYEALQQYKSLAAHKKPDAVQILSRGSCALLGHGQGEEGLELGKLLLEHLTVTDAAGTCNLYLDRACREKGMATVSCGSCMTSAFLTLH